MHRSHRTATLAGIIALLSVAESGRAWEVPYLPLPRADAAGTTPAWTAPQCPESNAAPGELEQLAIDIARRTLLAYHPHVAKNPIQTLEVRVRPEGDAVHTYARLVSFTDHKMEHPIESEVFATLIYTRGVRRMMDLSYKDDFRVPLRMVNRTSDLVAGFNTEFERRDPLQMPGPTVGSGEDMLAPRSRGWVWSLFQGDHAWHVFNADHRVRDGWLP